MLTQKELKEILHYNPKTGILTWLIRPSQSKKIGSIAGGRSVNGYNEISIKTKKHKAHRLAWLYIYGHWPKNEIDHINGDRFDNRIENLRDIKRVDNGRNQKLRKTNTSGCMGVTKDKDNKFIARIHVEDKRVYLGYWSCFYLAKAVRKAAELQYGYHQNHGR